MSHGGLRERREPASAIHASARGLVPGQLFLTILPITHSHLVVGGYIGTNCILKWHLLQMPEKPPIELYTRFYVCFYMFLSHLT